MSVGTREQFLQQVVQLIGRRFPLVKVEHEEGHFALRLNGQLASLESLYRIAAKAPDQLTRHIERWVVECLRASELNSELELSFAQARPSLRPVVLSTAAEMPWESIVHQLVVEGLYVSYAIDNDRSITYIPRGMFEDWNISLDDLHAAAIENLVAASESLAVHAAQDEQGSVSLTLIQTMDGYDASRILLPNLHERLSPHLGSPFLAAIPNRDILICFRNDAEIVERLRNQIESDFESMPYQVTDRLFLVTPDGIAPHVPIPE